MTANAGGPQAPPNSPRQSRDWKIVGSAQRRRGGAILQHGSVLLKRSLAAPELAGWNDLTDVPLTFAALADKFPRQLAAELSARFEPSGLPDAIREAARQIEAAKYADSAWTKRR